MAAYRRVDYL